MSNHFKYTFRDVPLPGVPWLVSLPCAPLWRPCLGRDYPEEGPEGGAAWNGDVGLE